MPITRIVSGGQTGVDRAALDVAQELGIEVGGWVPKGRLAEDGRVPDRYDLKETPSSDAVQRTEWNVRDSHATLFFSDGPLVGGSATTFAFAERSGRPHLHVDLSKTTVPEAVDAISRWLSDGRCEVLNVAGPRLSETPGVDERVRAVLRPVLAKIGVRRMR